MQILLINMTGNRDGWENDAVEILRTALQNGNNIRFEVFQDFSLVPNDIANDYYDFVIVVAHGNSGGSSAISDVQSEHSFAVLNQLIQSFSMSNILLLICEGANETAISDLNIGTPEEPVVK